MIERFLDKNFDIKETKPHMEIHLLIERKIQRLSVALEHRAGVTGFSLVQLQHLCIFHLPQLVDGQRKHLDDILLLAVTNKCVPAI